MHKISVICVQSTKTLKRAHNVKKLWLQKSILTPTDCFKAIIMRPYPQDAKNYVAQKYAHAHRLVLGHNFVPIPSECKELCCTKVCSCPQTAKLCCTKVCTCAKTAKNCDAQKSSHAQRLQRIVMNKNMRMRQDCKELCCTKVFACA